MNKMYKILFIIMCAFAFNLNVNAASLMDGMTVKPIIDVSIDVKDGNLITNANATDNNGNNIPIKGVGARPDCALDNHPLNNASMGCGHHEIGVQLGSAGASSYRGTISNGLKCESKTETIDSNKTLIVHSDCSYDIKCTSTTTSSSGGNPSVGTSEPTKPSCKEGSTYTLNYLVVKELDAIKGGTTSDDKDTLTFTSLNRISSKLDLDKYAILSQKSIDINSSNIVEFTNKYNSIKNSKMAIGSDKTYYIKPISYKVGDKTLNTISLKDFDARAAIIPDSKTEIININNYENKVDVKITRSINPISLKFIKTDGKVIDDKVYHPTWIEVSMCEVEEKDPETDCSVTSTPVKCEEGGSIASYHELEDGTATCSYNNGDIGFQIVYNDYCLVKGFDNIDISYPGKKKAYSGRYFTLDNYVPSAKGDRTYVGMVQADKFISDINEDNQNIKSSAESYKKNLDDIELKENEITNYVPPTPDPVTGNLPPGIKTLDDLERELADLQELKNQLKETYNSNLQSYVNHVNTYNSCYSWTMPMTNLKVSDNQIVSAGTVDDSKKYDIDMTPTFSLDYDDKDASVFNGGSSRNLKIGTDSVGKNYGTNSSVSFWDKGVSPDENLTNGGSSLFKTSITRVNCNLEDSECTESTSQIAASPWLKKTIKFEGEISLPTVYAIVPSGVVTTISKNNIELPPLSVPININTAREDCENDGDCKYTVTASNILPGRDSSLLSGLTPLVCDYNVINEIYLPLDNKFQFFYRSVNPANINHPNGQALGYNWSTPEAREVMEKMKENSENYQTLTDPDKNDQFKFRLTPTLMKQIRKYNSTVDNSFADFNLTCRETNEGSDLNNGYHCYSPFLSCITSKGQNAEGNSGVKTTFPDCQSVFEDALNGYDYPYDLSLLNENRNKLIQKQQSLGTN